MMEQSCDSPPESPRSSTIDLNESSSFSSSSSDYHDIHALSLVRTFHDHLFPPQGSPAELPSVSKGSLCPACSKPENRSAVVVCDGCERGFHFSCAFLQGNQMEEWKCGECISNAVPCNSWPLGVKTNNVCHFDINSVPVSDGEGEGTTDSSHSRKRTPGDNSFGVPVHAEKEFKASTFEPNIRTSSESILPQKQAIRRIFEEVDSNSVTNHHSVKMHLHALQDYILERVGVLEEGWYVEFKQSIASDEPYPVYCAPGGEIFESMAEVASYLESNNDNIRPTEGCHAAAPLQINPITRNCGAAADVCFRKSGNSVRAHESHKFNGRLVPVQYEDFFILSTGKIASSYHSEHQIWPIAYKSCWHDKITGSLFISEVCDDGEFGPIFKVTRHPCSSVTIPEASSVICSSNTVKSDPQISEKHSDITFRGTDYDGDSNLLMILSEPSPPGEDDILSCLSTSSVSDQSNRFLALPDRLCFTDEIGEFSVEGSSSSSAWSMVSETLIHACRRSYMQTGSLKFFCKHAEDTAYEKDENILVSLVKFRGISNSVKIPSFIGSFTELETLNEVLTKWIDQDRFGLDSDFVQEIIEQLPGAKDCLRYIFLNERSSYASSLIVENGSLMFKSKYTDDPVVNDHCLPPGNPISSKVPPHLYGEVLQVLEFLGRFYDVLDIKEPLSVVELEKELVNPWFEGVVQEIGPTISAETSQAFIQMGKQAAIEVEQSNTDAINYCRPPMFALNQVQNSLLKPLVTELQSKVVTVDNPKLDNGEVKSRRGRKKDNDSSITAKRMKLTTLHVNELTWPELSRRYILSILAMNGNHDLPEVITREAAKVLRCLQGDGGVLCGSMTGVAGMEADAQLLAEASKKIFGPLKKENDVLFIEDGELDLANSSDQLTANNGDVPEWAKVLEPVRKLPTNVGARIKKCVNEALEKCPPEWAKIILERSISKEVYKGNASGPTKKAVVSVLDKLNTEGFPQKPITVKKKMRSVSISNIIMKKCRIILRHVAKADVDKIICNLLGRKLIHCSDNNDDEGILGSPAAVSRPLDLRTIDLRLAVGVYGGSHEAFVEDVREFWNNVRTAYADQSNMVELAHKLSSNLESLFIDEVVTLYNKLVGYSKLKTLSADSKKEVDELLVSSPELPKAPWEEEVCKVCGVDSDDNGVLLCDTCDAEYHYYCLNPPLARIPEGNWYCPSCVAGKGVVQDSSKVIKKVTSRKKIEGEFTCVNMDMLSHLATALEERDYWNLSVEERTLLLKFLCDELLNSAFIRQHLEKSVESSADLQLKLRSLYVEWKNLKSKEEKMILKAARMERSSLKSAGQVVVGESSVNSLTNDTQILRLDSIGGSQSACNSSIHVADYVLSDLDQGDVVETEPQDRAAASDKLQSDGVELSSLKNEILLLQKSIAVIETELIKLSSRREDLGRDSFGRLYWILTEWVSQPSLTANGNAEFLPRGKIMCYSDTNPDSSKWVSYESVAEIEELVKCLNKDDPMEKELKESIINWQKLGFCKDEGERENVVYRPLHRTNSKEYCTDLVAKATYMLETIYAPSYQSQVIDSSRKSSRKSKLSAELPNIYRCECLEPVWQSRNHCVSCHKTFYNSSEFGKHSEGKCIKAPLTSNRIKDDTEISKGKGTTELVTGPENEPTFLSNPNMIKFQNNDSPCPFNFEEICSKFMIKSSNKELVKEIGLIGSNGIASFVLSLPPYLSDPALNLVASQETVGPNTDESTQYFNQPSRTLAEKYSSSSVMHNVSESQKGGKAGTSSRGSGIIDANCCIVPEAALKPLVGKDVDILKQLKLNLLDMHAVLSEEALRPSKKDSEQRRAWCEFVKSAQTIYEMVQALIVFEDAIRSEYLTNTWWYWSSLSVAAKISTLSALALRIYSLDASIEYEKLSSDNAPVSKPVSDSLPLSSDSPEKSKSIRKSTKKRKESEA